MTVTVYDEPSVAYDDSTIEYDGTGEPTPPTPPYVGSVIDCAPYPGVTEYIEYITPDGIHFPLDMPPKRRVLSESGDGTPPIDYVTQRGAYQHGVSLINTFLKPRIVQLVIRHQFTSRFKYWDGRADLLNMIRPNRQGLLPVSRPGHLVSYTGNNKVRWLDCYINKGPGWTPTSTSGSSRDSTVYWDEFALQELLEFIAFNPIYYDPSMKSIILSSGAQLVFPITFPIIFTNLDSTAVITYNGTWEEYPKIIITGPIVNPLIQHNNLGQIIHLNYSVVAGEVVTIDLTYGVKTVTSSINGNIIYALTEDSDIAGFHIAADDEISGGVNNIHVQGGGTASTSNIEIDWFERYFGK